MLSRVANSLYWMGRYVERSEHLARYLNVQYFSTLDAPMSQNKHFVLKSIMNMGGIVDKDEDKKLSEEEVLFKVALDKENPYSIISFVRAGRENARSIRSSISAELWESINKYYHFMESYPIDVFQTRGLYDLCFRAIRYCAVIRANMYDTLIHDNVYAMMNLGIHLERAVQITRILSSKLYDIFSINMALKDQNAKPIENYQWTITLKALEAFDMYHRFYNPPLRQKHICEFLIINPNFPRSIAFNVNEVKNYVNDISLQKTRSPDSLEFFIEKNASYYKFLDYSEISDDLQKFLGETLENMYKINERIQQGYMQL